MKLEHVVMKNGRRTFRRRIPKDILKLIGKTFFQETMREQASGVGFVQEHAALMGAFTKLVEDARNGEFEKLPKEYALEAWTSLDDPRSPRERWYDSITEAKKLISSVVGADSDEDRRAILADDMSKRGQDPELYKAVVSPDAAPPPISLLDARNMYLKEKLEGAKGRNQRNRLDRICGRIVKSLGPLDRIALVDLKRDHARKLRDDMLSTKKVTGDSLSAATIKRELGTVSSMINIAIREFDLP